jgi:hypothetical protein
MLAIAVELDTLIVVIVMTHVLHSRFVYLHDVYELWKERCSSDKEAVDVGAGHQGPAEQRNIRCYKLVHQVTALQIVILTYLQLDPFTEPP